MKVFCQTTALRLMLSQFSETDIRLKMPTKKKIIDLRNRISQKMTDTQCEDNLFELEYDENYINRFSEKVKELILKNINIEIERLEREKSTCKTYSMIEEMFGNENEFYFRERELSVLTTYVKGDSCRPMVVCGDSGSGKSRMLYEVVKLYESETVYSFFRNGRT